MNIIKWVSLFNSRYWHTSVHEPFMWRTFLSFPQRFRSSLPLPMPCRGLLLFLLSLLLLLLPVSLPPCPMLWDPPEPSPLTVDDIATLGSLKHPDVFALLNVRLCPVTCLRKKSATFHSSNCCILNFIDFVRLYDFTLFFIHCCF